jgi:hypothetical protein
MQFFLCRTTIPTEKDIPGLSLLYCKIRRYFSVFGGSHASYFTGRLQHDTKERRRSRVLFGFLGWAPLWGAVCMSVRMDDKNEPGIAFWWMGLRALRNRRNRQNHYYPNHKKYRGFRLENTRHVHSVETTFFQTLFPWRRLPPSCKDNPMIAIYFSHLM